MRSLFIFLMVFAYSNDQIPENAPCFAEVTLVSADKHTGSWLTLKRSNTDACSFDPATTSIHVSAKIEPSIHKMSDGWVITFSERNNL